MKKKRLSRCDSPEEKSVRKEDPRGRIGKGEPECGQGTTEKKTYIIKLLGKILRHEDS